MLFEVFLSINSIAKMQWYWYLVVQYDYSIVVLFNFTLTIPSWHLGSV